MSRNGEAKNTHVQSRPMTGPNRHCNSGKYHLSINDRFFLIYLTEVVGESQVCASRTTFSSPKDTHLPGIFGAVSFSPFSSIPPRWKEKKNPHLMDGENCSECVGRASKLSLEQKCEPFCDTTGYKLPAKTTTFPCESTNGSVEDITTDPGDQRPSSANVTGLGSISEQEDEVSLLEWLESYIVLTLSSFRCCRSPVVTISHAHLLPRLPFNSLVTKARVITFRDRQMLLSSFAPPGGKNMNVCLVMKPIIGRSAGWQVVHGKVFLMKRRSLTLSWLV